MITSAGHRDKDDAADKGPLLVELFVVSERATAHFLTGPIRFSGPDSANIICHDGTWMTDHPGCGTLVGA